MQAKERVTGPKLVRWIAASVIAGVMPGATLVLLTFHGEGRQYGVPDGGYYVVIPIGVAAVIGWILRPRLPASLLLAVGNYGGILGGLYFNTYHAIGSGKDTAFFTLAFLAVGSPLGVVFLF